MWDNFRLLSGYTCVFLKLKLLLLPHSPLLALPYPIVTITLFFSGFTMNGCVLGRTAASLLFESLRGVVRERHRLKGAGVRVTAVAGLELPSKGSVKTAVGLASHGSAPRDHHQKGTTPALKEDEKSPQIPFNPCPEVLDAVGSGVISVLPGGIAVVEHLGRKSYGDDGAEEGSGNGVHDDGFEGGGVYNAGGGSSSASLWRMRATRRRRQARADKMRSLVTWATGDRMLTWKSGGAEGGGRFNGVGGPGRGRGMEHGIGHGGSRQASVVGGKPVAVESRVQRPLGPSPPVEESNASQGEGMGWGVKLQARALAIPASFLPKRT